MAGVEKLKKRIMEKSNDSAADEFLNIDCGVSYNADTIGCDWV